MSNQSNTSNEKQQTVRDIIHEVEQKSKGGGYIYRGERKCYKKISSSLYRDFGIETEGFDIEVVQKEMLNAAKKHRGDLPQDFRLDVIVPPNTVGESTQEAIDFEILTEIQHYGGKTNLIDFTTDYFIALFFACDGRYDEDGRVILQKIDEIRSMIKHPRNPRHRVIAQKSVFVRPPKGFIEPREDEIIMIPSYLKQPMLEHLRNYHAIFTETIYNDLHGFIRNQDIHGDAHTHFYRGFACQDNGDRAKTPEEKKKEYEKSIEHYTQAIQLRQDYVAAYNNRGNVYVEKGDFDQAIRDHTQAIALRPDFPEAYSNRGVAYMEKGDFDQAIRDHTQAIAFKSDYVKAYNNRGVVYLKKRAFDQAIRDYTQAIQLKPDYAEAHNNRGVAYESKGAFDQAIQDYTQAIQLEQNYANAYRNRGEAWLRLREWEKAKADLTTARDMGMDIIAKFHSTFGNIANFERIKGIQLPEDIVALLTPP